jgi:hypothetical protein
VGARIDGESTGAKFYKELREAKNSRPGRPTKWYREDLSCAYGLQMPRPQVEPRHRLPTKRYRRTGRRGLSETQPSVLLLAMLGKSFPKQAGRPRAPSQQSSRCRLLGKCPKASSSDYSCQWGPRFFIFVHREPGFASGRKDWAGFLSRASRPRKLPSVLAIAKSQKRDVACV